MTEPLRVTDATRLADCMADVSVPSGGRGKIGFRHFSTESRRNAATLGTLRDWEIPFGSAAPARFRVRPSSNGSGPRLPPSILTGENTVSWRDATPQTEQSNPG